MFRQTNTKYTFIPPNEDPRAKDLKYVAMYAVDVVPTGKWKFSDRDGFKNKHNMYIQVEFTRISNGTKYTDGYWKFLRYIKKSREEIAFTQKKQLMWVNEYEVNFYTTTLYSCGEEQGNGTNENKIR